MSGEIENSQNNDRLKQLGGIPQMSFQEVMHRTAVETILHPTPMAKQTVLDLHPQHLLQKLILLLYQVRTIKFHLNCLTTYAR